MNNRCLVKTGHTSPPNGNVNTHKATNGSQCSTAVGAGSVTAAVVPRFACASKDCAASRPQGKAKNLLWWYPRSTSWYFTGTTGTSLITDTRYRRYLVVYMVSRLYHSYRKQFLSAHREMKPADPTALRGLPPAPPVTGASS